MEKNEVTTFKVGEEVEFWEFNHAKHCFEYSITKIIKINQENEFSQKFYDIHTKQG